MKNQNGWTAFRKQRFYENQRRKKEKQCDETNKEKVKKFREELYQYSY